MKCDICGKEEVLPYKCNYCGGTFCSEHRLPEKHFCEGIYDIPVKVKKDWEIGRERSVTIQKPKVSISQYGYNNIFLGIITLMFFVSLIFPQIMNFLALYPDKFYYMPWQLVTSIFLHGSFDHYLVNAIVLLFFGGELERRLGSKRYLEIFFLSGIAGNFFYILFSFATNNFAPAVGASGALYGIMGALALIAPEIRVLLFFVIPVDIKTAILLFAAYNILMLPFTAFTGVAYIAHLGGLLVGLYYGKKYSIYRRFRVI